MIYTVIKSKNFSCNSGQIRALIEYLRSRLQNEGEGNHQWNTIHTNLSQKSRIQ